MSVTALRSAAGATVRAVVDAFLSSKRRQNPNTRRAYAGALDRGERNVSLQLIMAKTRHRNPRTVMRYVKPGPVAVAEVTELLDIAGRRSAGG